MNYPGQAILEINKGVGLKLVDLGKLKEIPNVVVYGIAAAAVLFIYFIFYPPLIKEIKKKSQECKSVESRLQEAHNAIDYSQTRDIVLPRSESPARLVLTGVFLDKESPQAIINDNIVSIGDKVRGSVVKEIKEDRVVLNDGNKDFELRLNQ
ncbi:MAG: hypothetical protein NT033_06485 [Candidatus Omnitrophica bacterium]|nr:hypothetical protein [Candidatus Omnitrophota bacterium]